LAVQQKRQSHEEPKKNQQTNKTINRTNAWQHYTTNIKAARGNYNRKAEQQIPSAHNLYT
jgi:hypothetical protein